MPLLKLTDIKLEIQGNPILDGVSFEVNTGDVIGLMGKSGAGKTSLFRTLNLLQSPTQGIIYYQNQDTLTYPPAVLRREIGYVFQKTYLFSSTIKDNLLYPYQLMQQKPDFEEIIDYLNKANLPESIMKKKIHELSGGEQQRVALIRSLLIKPRILLLDEVTASLDEDNTLIIEKLIRDQNENKHVTILFISHNTGQSDRLAQKILYLEKGKVTYYGSKNDYFRKKE